MDGKKWASAAKHCSLNAISMAEWADKVLRYVSQAVHYEKVKTKCEVNADKQCQNTSSLVL